MSNSFEGMLRVVEDGRWELIEDGRWELIEKTRCLKGSGWISWTIYQVNEEIINWRLSQNSLCASVSKQRDKIQFFKNTVWKRVSNELIYFADSMCLSMDFVFWKLNSEISSQFSGDGKAVLDVGDRQRIHLWEKYRMSRRKLCEWKCVKLQWTMRDCFILESNWHKCNKN